MLPVQSSATGLSFAIYSSRELKERQSHRDREQDRLEVDCHLVLELSSQETMTSYTTNKKNQSLKADQIMRRVSLFSRSVGLGYNRLGLGPGNGTHGM
jgi:hypothetical protein